MKAYIVIVLIMIVGILSVLAYFYISDSLEERKMVSNVKEALGELELNKYDKRAFDANRKVAAALLMYQEDNGKLPDSVADIVGQGLLTKGHDFYIGKGIGVNLVAIGENTLNVVTFHYKGNYRHFHEYPKKKPFKKAAITDYDRLLAKEFYGDFKRR